MCGAKVGVSLVNGAFLGFAGNVEYDPSVLVRLLGGLPLSLPVELVPLLGQADDTVGGFLRRALGLLGVRADCGSGFSFQGAVCRKVGVIAVRGYADVGVSTLSRVACQLKESASGNLPSTADHVWKLLCKPG